MKPQVDSIDASDPRNIGQEEAEQVGKQMGMAVVAAIVHTGFQRYVGSSVEVMKSSNEYQRFLSALVRQLEEGLESGMPGMRARAHMARHLQAGHVAMRAQLHEMSFVEGEKDLAVIDSLLETGEIVDKAVRALTDPLENNLKELCLQGKQVELVKKMRQAQQQSQIDHIRDEVECNDPECDIHKTH